MVPNELACAIAELIAAASGVGASFADVCIPAAVFKAAPEPLGGHFKLLKIVSLQALTTLPGEMAQQLGIIRTPKKDEEEPKKILENKLRWALLVSCCACRAVPVPARLPASDVPACCRPCL